MPDVHTLLTLAVSVGMMLAFGLGLMALYGKLYITLEQGSALVVNKMAEVDVFFTGGLVLPGLHRSERVDMTTRQLAIRRVGERGIFLRDGTRVQLEADVYFRIGRTSADVLRAATRFGAEATADDARLVSHFLPKIESAVEMVCASIEFDRLLSERGALARRLLEELGDDHDGFVFDDVAVRVLAPPSLEATP